jgi:AraC-like DNA-binding protein
VGLTPNQLSQVLNQGLEVSFFDFVNGYRVREVQRRLRDPEASSLTHLALALEAGFSSKSSFHRIFRKHVGQTPKEYARGDAVHREAD